MSTITLKAGTAYDAPWFVSEADTAEQHRTNLMDFLGVTAKTEDENGNEFGKLTLLDITCIASELFQGRYALTSSPTPSRGRSGGSSKAATQAKPAQAAPEPSGAKFLEAIEAHTDKVELQKFFVKNRAEMEGDAEVMQALKDKFATFN